MVYYLMHLLSAYAVENPRLKKNEKKIADMVQTNMLAFMKSFCQQQSLPCVEVIRFCHRLTVKRKCHWTAPLSLDRKG